MAGDIPPSPQSPGNDEEANDEPVAGRPSSPSPADRAQTGDDIERVRRHLLASVGSLYALAQVLTGSEREARRLVEATYERAAEALAARQAPDAPEARSWILSLLVHTARLGAQDAARREVSDGEGAGRDDYHFRRRAQERFLRRALPSSFAALGARQRLLLMLCDIEQLDVPTAAAVADLDEDTARQQVARARAELRDTLRQMAPRPERSFLEEEALPDTRLQIALRQMAKRDLTAPPSALRPAARHALRHHATGRAAPPAPESPPPSRSKRLADSDTPSPRPAPDRSAAPRREAFSAWDHRLPRLLTALLLIAVAGGVAYLTTVVLDRPAETNLAALSAQQASGVDVRLRTERPEQAEQFVYDELGRRLTVPDIQSTTLRGVGITEVVPGERVPVFLFRDSSSGHPVTAYAYDYALLDRTANRLRLPRGLRQQLEEEGQFAVEEVAERRVLLWRHRDDIFAAVTAPTDSLQQRIAF